MLHCVAWLLPVLVPSDAGFESDSDDEIPMETECDVSGELLLKKRFCLSFLT